jgi:hypothetical protein
VTLLGRAVVEYIFLRWTIYPADLGSPDADSFFGGPRSSGALQYQPNGCSDEAVVHDGGRQPEERSAAAGITGVARTTGAAISPLFAGLLFARPSLINVPFFLAGGLKIVMT